MSSSSCARASCEFTIWCRFCAPLEIPPRPESGREDGDYSRAARPRLGQSQDRQGAGAGREPRGGHTADGQVEEASKGAQRQQKNKEEQQPRDRIPGSEFLAQVEFREPGGVALAVRQVQPIEHLPKALRPAEVRESEPQRDFCGRRIGHMFDAAVEAPADAGLEAARPADQLGDRLRVRRQDGRDVSEVGGEGGRQVGGLALLDSVVLLLRRPAGAPEVPLRLQEFHQPVHSGVVVVDVLPRAGLSPGAVSGSKPRSVSHLDGRTECIGDLISAPSHLRVVL